MGNEVGSQGSAAQYSALKDRDAQHQAVAESSKWYTTATQFRWRIVDSDSPDPYDVFISDTWEDEEQTALENGRQILENAVYLTDEAKAELEIKIDT
uniref:Uncharacterized protein n=1 Tax=Plectus sambesii TaxID=2011161 RepID=A0A914VMP2_9BILA